MMNPIKKTERISKNNLEILDISSGKLQDLSQIEQESVVGGISSTIPRDLRIKPFATQAEKDAYYGTKDGRPRFVSTAPDYSSWGDSITSRLS